MTLSPDRVQRFADIIERNFGVCIGDRSSFVDQLVARRVGARRMTVEDYLRALERADREELRVLAGEIAIGETYFFRHLDQFHACADALFAIVAQRGRARVLSAGCSTGEEPYTLAIVVRERGLDPRAVEIHAIDINPIAVERARRGRYGSWALRATPPVHETRWFQPDGSDVVLSQTIRDAVSFAEGNVLDARWTPSSWDVVICRNMLMYLAAPTAAGVVARMVEAIAPGGYLFVGHAEMLRDYASLGLELCHTHGTFYYRRHGATRSEAPASDDNWVDAIAAASARTRSVVDAALDRRDVAPPSTPLPATLLSIREFVRDERYTEARLALGQLPQDAHVDLDAALLRAVVAAHTQDIAGARELCRQLLDAGAHVGSARYLMAMCDDSTGDATSAARHAAEALVSEPRFAMASVFLGLLARRRKDRDAAIAYLTRALADLPGEQTATLELLAGGFSRASLLGMCRAELDAAKGGR